MGDEVKPESILRGIMLFMVLSVAWPMVLFFVIAPLINLDVFLESDVGCLVIGCIIILPIFVPPIIILLLDARQNA